MGLYTITTRADGTVLTGFGSTSDIFNADHENHVLHTAAEFLNSWEATLSQMQDTTSPFAGSALSLPTTLADEIERLRFQIARIKQQIAGAATPPFWYDATASFTNAIILAPTAARISQSTSFVLASGVLTQMAFNTVVYDTASMRVGSTLVAPVNGVYICGATLAFGDGLTQGPEGLFKIVLRVTRGTTNFDIAANAIWSVGDEPKSLVVETVKYLQEDDVLKLMVLQEDGSPKAPVSTAQARPAMWMSLQGRGDAV